MTAEPDLLPLPRTLRHPSDAGVAEHVQAYARANVAHATAAKDAEIEALRAEVERSERYAEQSERERLWTEARAEQLAEEVEALRAKVERANSWNERVSVCRDHVADIVDGPCVICALDAAGARADKLRAEVERLRTDLMESDEIREKLGHLLTRTAAALKGEPPAGVWHSWHDLPEKAAQLAEALRKLEEREQSDEALLRQALEALERGAWDTLSGRNTAFAIRERLGLGQEESHEQ